MAFPDYWEMVGGNQAERDHHVMVPHHHSQSHHISIPGCRCNGPSFSGFYSDRHWLGLGW